MAALQSENHRLTVMVKDFEKKAAKFAEVIKKRETSDIAEGLAHIYIHCLIYCSLGEKKREIKIKKSKLFSNFIYLVICNLVVI